MNLLIPISVLLMSSITISVNGGVIENFIKFKLSAMNLQKEDLNGLSDPYVKIYMLRHPTRHHDDWDKIGETGVVNQNLTPVWHETFTIPYTKGSNQKVKFLVKDYDVGWFPDDHLGRVVMTMDELMSEMKTRNSSNPQPLAMSMSEPAGGILQIWPVTE